MNLKWTMVIEFILLSLTISAGQLTAQSKEDSIFLSTKLTLGMDEVTVIGALAEHYAVEKAKNASGKAPSIWMLKEKAVVPNEEPRVVQGIVQFLDGKLVSANKFWNPALAESPIDVADAMLGVVQQFEREHRNVVELYTEDINTPEFHGYVITLRSGKKFIRIDANRRRDAPSVNVTETLEDFHH